MQVADSRMIASVGCRIVGSGRSSTRMSPGAWRMAPRMVWVPSVVVAAEDPLGDGHGRHGPGPACVEGEVGDGFDELVLGVAVLLGEVEVEDELVGVACGGQCGDGDEAALLGRELGALPHLCEQDVVG